MARFLPEQAVRTTNFPRMIAPLDTLPIPPNDHDALLLEGLFQLAMAGEIDSFEFEKIEQEVHARLMAAYTA